MPGENISSNIFSHCHHGRRIIFNLVLLVGVALTAGVAVAADPPVERNFDARIAYNQAFDVAIGTAQHRAARAIQTPGLDLTATYDSKTGATRSLSNRVGYLSAPINGEAIDIGLGYARANLDLLGLLASDLDSYEVTDNVYSAVSGATHVYLRQQHQGLSVYNGQLHFNVNRDGRLLSINNAFLPEIATAVNAGTPSLSAQGAVTAAAEHLEISLANPLVALGKNPSGHGLTTLRSPELSYRDIEARLMWLPIRRGDARLVWNFQIFTTDRGHMYDFTVDAHSGDVWTRFDWVGHATYRVFEQPVESPIHSASPPPSDGRTVATNPSDPTASPLGWHDDGTTSFTTPQGNNVHAFDDLDGNNLPPAVEPDCGAPLTCEFDFPIPFGTADPVDYTSASVANLFYWANIVHDVQYQYGFDEAGGNFQANNFGNGGLGSDDVTAFGQKSGSPCPNNAFFGTPPDGQNPSMIMCLWTNSSPRRDFSWDSGVMVHEYGHGISNRLVGGPSNVSCLGNLQQPGEGLSDWWGLVYTAEVGDQGTDVRGSGTYILGQAPDGPGVRAQPYSTDPAVNTFTYESINGASVPHGVGTVWAQAAWEGYWALVDHHGFDPDLYDALGGSGNQRMMLYVNEGLKNTLCSPAFTDVRDGIIQAAVDNYGGSDVCRLWEAFAGFGLGTDAVSSGSGGLTPTDGFLVPPECLTLIFEDGFETGNTTNWSSVTP